MDIINIQTQRVLSPTQITLSDYVINPYRGCEFGCLYCYSQSNKNIKNKNFLNFLGVKTNAPKVLGKELKKIKPKRVLLGSITECFQYQEIRYGISKKILELLNKHKIPYTILTKSILRDAYIDLISQNKQNKIYFTLNFHCDEIIHLLEKKSPPLKERLSTIKKIIDKNIRLRIHIGPFIPLFSSLEKIIKLVPDQVKEIDIELYHNKQGNFRKILNQTEKYYGKEKKIALRNIYSSKTNYTKFANILRKKIMRIKKSRNADFFYIVPDYNQFYNSNINYENTVL